MKLRPPTCRKSFAGRCKVFPERNTLLLPYQAAWVKDGSRLKLAEKSRQIGWTWCSAYRLVSTKSMADARLDAWISSRDDIQARLFLEDCKGFATLLQTAAEDLGEQAIDDKGHTAYVLAFANKLRAHSMSSNPDAQAGKRGDRILDEFALHPDPRKLYSIAYPGITWGGSMEIFSTHRGTGNFFNELVREIREKGNPKRISLHRVTLQDALDQGFLFKLQTKLPADDPRQEMDEAEYYAATRAGCADEESFLQEFMCVPGDDTTAFLSYDLIATCLMRGADNLSATTEQTRDLTGRKGTIRRLQNLTLEEIAALPFPLYVGVDIGRLHDLTCPWIAAKIGDVLTPVAISKWKAWPSLARRRSSIPSSLCPECAAPASIAPVSAGSLSSARRSASACTGSRASTSPPPPRKRSRIRCAPPTRIAPLASPMIASLSPTIARSRRSRPPATTCASPPTEGRTATPTAFGRTHSANTRARAHLASCSPPNRWAPGTGPAARSGCAAKGTSPHEHPSVPAPGQQVARRP
ncbi:MAG: hypothetical protein IPL39_14495 [Opitutaceae bacterium]|nr:hypothetical protein [Opitutaceae bacterium]